MDNHIIKNITNLAELYSTVVYYYDLFYLYLINHGLDNSANEKAIDDLLYHKLTARDNDNNTSFHLSIPFLIGYKLNVTRNNIVETKNSFRIKVNQIHSIRREIKLRAVYFTNLNIPIEITYDLDNEFIFNYNLFDSYRIRYTCIRKDYDREVLWAYGSCKYEIMDEQFVLIKEIGFSKKYASLKRLKVLNILTKINNAKINDVTFYVNHLITPVLKNISAKRISSMPQANIYIILPINTETNISQIARSIEQILNKYSIENSREQIINTQIKRTANKIKIRFRKSITNKKSIGLNLYVYLLKSFT